MTADFEFHLPELSLMGIEALPTEALLKETLKLARESWAHDFLFKLDVAAEVGVLTSPSQLQHGIVVDTTESVFETDGQYGGIFNADVFVRWLVVPCIAAINDISAEVIVQSEERLSSKALCQCRGTTSSSFRMLRSNKTGELLFSIENPAADEISLEAFRIDTKGARQRTFLRGRRKAFLEAALRPEGADYRKMAQSLEVSYVTQEIASCAGCSAAAPGLGCLCPVDLKKPVHPLDFATSRMNLACHRGRFSGSCNLDLLAEGAPVTSAKLASTIHVDACEEIGLAEMLAKMAIKNKVQANAVVPRSLPRLTSFENFGLSSPGKVAGHDTRVQASIYPLHGFNTLSTRNLLLGDPLDPDGTCTAPTPPDSDAPRGEHAPTKANSLMPAGVIQAKETPDRNLRRKMKNREAAARSNLRRKQRNDALKKNLSTARKKKCELELRMSELKRENAALQKLVKGSGRCFFLKS